MQVRLSDRNAQRNEGPMCGLACDDGLPADANLADTARSNCGSGLAREGGLTVNTVGPGTYPLFR